MKMFILWSTAIWSLLRVSEAVPELESFDCKFSEAAAGATAAIDITNACDSPTLSFKSNEIMVGEIASRIVTFYQSSIGPTIGVDQLEGVDPYIKVIGTQNIEEQTTQNFVVPVTSQTLTYPEEECGQYFVIAVFEVKGDESSSFSTSYVPFAKGCMDAEEGLDLEVQIVQDDDTWELSFDDQKRIVPKGFTLEVKNGGTVNLQARTMLDAVSVRADLMILEEDWFVSEMDSLMEMDMQNVSDQLRDIYIHYRYLRYSDVDLTGLELALVTDDGKTGISLDAGDTVRLDLTSVESSVDPSFICKFEDKILVLVVTVDPLHEVSDKNSINNRVYLPISRSMCSPRSAGFSSPMKRMKMSTCQVFPDFRTDGADAKIIMRGGMGPKKLFLYKGKYGGFMEMPFDPYYLKKDFEVLEKSKRLERKDLCPDPPVDDNPKEFLDHSLEITYLELVNKILQDVQNIDMENAVAKNDKEVFAAFSAIVQEVLNAYSAIENSEFRQFVIRYEKLHLKQYMMLLPGNDGMPPKAPSGRPGSKDNKYNNIVFPTSNAYDCYMTCDQKRTCLTRDMLCNGQIDCEDGFDERNCTRKKRSAGDGTLQEQFRPSTGELTPEKLSTGALLTARRDARGTSSQSAESNGVPSIESLGMNSVESQSVERTNTNPAQTPGQVPAQNPAQNPGQNPGQTPRQTPGQVPAQNPAQTPGQNPGQAPAQTPGQNPAQNPGQTPAGNPGRSLNPQLAASSSLQEQIFDIFQSQRSEEPPLDKQIFSMFNNFESVQNGFLGIKRQFNKKGSNKRMNKNKKNMNKKNYPGFSKEDKDFLMLLKKLTVRLMTVHSPEQMSEFDFIPNEVLIKVFDYINLAKTRRPLFWYAEPWLALKLGNPFSGISLAMYQTTLMMMEDPAMLEGLTEQTKVFWENIITNTSEVLRTAFASNATMIQALDFSLELFNVLSNNLGDLINLTSKFIIMVKDEKKILKAGQPGREPDLSMNCLRAAGMHVAAMDEMKPMESGTEAPYTNFMQQIKPKMKTMPNRWLNYKGEIYVGERSKFFGEMFWTRQAVCSCPKMDYYGQQNIQSGYKNQYKNQYNRNKGGKRSYKNKNYDGYSWDKYDDSSEEYYDDDEYNDDEYYDDEYDDDEYYDQDQGSNGRTGRTNNGRTQGRANRVNRPQEQNDENDGNQNSNSGRNRGRGRNGPGGRNRNQGDGTNTNGDQTGRRNRNRQNRPGNGGRGTQGGANGRNGISTDNQLQGTDVQMEVRRVGSRRNRNRQRIDDVNQEENNAPRSRTRPNGANQNQRNGNGRSWTNRGPNNRVNNNPGRGNQRGIQFPSRSQPPPPQEDDLNDEEYPNDMDEFFDSFGLPPVDDPMDDSFSGNLPSGNSPEGNWPSGNWPSGNWPSGNWPSGNLPSNFPSGNLPGNNIQFPGSNIFSGFLPSALEANGKDSIHSLNVVAESRIHLTAVSLVEKPFGKIEVSGIVILEETDGLTPFQQSTLCADAFGLNEAHLVCHNFAEFRLKKLNEYILEESRPFAENEQLNGFSNLPPIRVSNLKCNSGATEILRDCSHAGWDNQNKCISGRPAAVRCLFQRNT